MRFPLLAPRRPAARETFRPDIVPASAQDFVHASETALEEPVAMKGMVFLQSPDDEVTILKSSGETTEALPPDVPATSLKENRAFFYIDGIHHELSEQERHISLFLQGNSPVGASVGQDVVGIHEGAGKTVLQDTSRIGKVLILAKLLHTGLVPLKWTSKKLFTIDPSVKAAHDEIKQSLLAGRKVEIMAHSGGGAETVAALNLLCKEGMRQQISDNVRLLAVAPAASRKDFENAGIQSANLYYTGSVKDPVYSVFRNHVSLLTPISDLKFGVDAAKYALTLLHKEPDRMVYHSPDYIFSRNTDEHGQRIQQFVDGQSGGSYPV